MWPNMLWEIRFRYKPQVTHKNYETMYYKSLYNSVEPLTQVYYI